MLKKKGKNSNLLKACEKGCKTKTKQNKEMVSTEQLDGMNKDKNKKRNILNFDLKVNHCLSQFFKKI